MKKASFVLIFALILCILTCLVACGSSDYDVTELGFTVVYDENSELDVIMKNKLITYVEASTGDKLAESSNQSESFEYELRLTGATERSDVSELSSKLAANCSEYISGYAIRSGENCITVAVGSPEAASVAVDRILEFIKDGRLLVPKNLDETVYFDLSVYNSTKELVTFTESELQNFTTLASISVFGNALADFSQDKLEYDLPVNAIVGLPSEDDITAVTYLPSMTYSVKISGRTAYLNVKSPNGNSFKEYVIKMISDSEYTVGAEIVNKNGAKGVLTLISDDGDQRTSDFFYTEVAPAYNSFKITIALPTKKVATLSKTADGKAWLINEDGKYALTVLSNNYSSAIKDSPFKGGAYKTMVDFWKKITDSGQIEIASHSHTHSAWGLTDEYNAPYPAGNVIKELRASAQILRDLIGQDTPFILRPGGHTDLTSSYFYSLVESDDTFIGMRGSNGAPPFVGATSASGAKLNTIEKFQDATGRLRIATILVRGYEAAFDSTGKAFVTTSTSTNAECIAAGVSAWEQYVDYAIQYGSWASLGFHSVVADNVQGSGYQVYDSQVKALMDYVEPLVESGDLWLPSFAEAAKYYFEWSSATLEAKAYGDSCIKVKLTDEEEDERFDEKLTVKVSVPAEWTSCNAELAGVSEPLTVKTDDNGGKYVYVNILPGSGIVTLTPAS